MKPPCSARQEKDQTVAVLGPDAYPAVIGGGGSSLSNPFSSVSYLEGISNYLVKKVRVAYVAEKRPSKKLSRVRSFSLTPAANEA